MPIQITLSDEAAADIMRQITEGLSKRAVHIEGVSAQDLFQKGLQETYKHVDTMQPGDHLHVATFATRRGIPTGSVSDALQKLKKRGHMDMKCKGTWVKPVPAIARAV